MTDPQADLTSRRLIAYAILAVLLLVDSSPLSGVSFCLATAYSIFAIRDTDFGFSIPYRLFGLLVPLMLIVVLGLEGALVHDSRDFVRDLWYFLHPIAVIAFGYLWFRRWGNLGGLIDIYSFAGVLAGLGRFYFLFANWPKIFLLGSLDQYRYLVGPGNMINITAVGMILLAQSRGFHDSSVLRRPWLKRLVLTVCLVAVAISFSRILLVSLICGYLLTLSITKLLKRLILFALLGTFLSVGTPYLTAGSYGDSFLSQFISKVERSKDEVAIKPFQNTSDIENNWRGYEAYRALKTFNEFNSLHQFIGGGYGQLVDLGFEHKVYDFDFVRIPLIHNGYAYILIKVGLLGELLFAYFLARCLLPFWQARGADRESPEHIWGVISLWIVLVMVLTQVVAGGIYSKSDYDSVSCLVGFCFAGTEGMALLSRQGTSRTQTSLASI